MTLQQTQPKVFSKISAQPNISVVANKTSNNPSTQTKTPAKEKHLKKIIGYSALGAGLFAGTIFAIKRGRFEEKGLPLEKIEDIFSPECLAKAKEFFNSTSHLQTKLWTENGGTLNPIAVKKLEELESLSLEEQKAFIKIYKDLTGFPDLKKVSESINKETVDIINTLAKKYNFKPLYAGYTSTCSVAKNLALPGSDADGTTYVIDLITKMPSGIIRGELGDITNQNIVSISNNFLPEVITLDALKANIKLAEKMFREQNFSPAEIEKFKNNLNTFNPNFSEGADFNMRLMKSYRIPQSTEEYIKRNGSSEGYIRHIKQSLKYDFLATCQFIENFREKGVHNLLNHFDKDTVDMIENSCLYKYSNISQQKTLKSFTKDKLIEREKLLKNFDNLSIKEQFEIIKNNIRHQFGSEEFESVEFKKLYENKGAKTFDLNKLVEMYERLTST